MLLYLIGTIKFKYYRRMVFMVKKNVTGICVASIYKPSVHRILSVLSDLYHNTKNDTAQKCIFNLVGYNRICC